MVEVVGGPGVEVGGYKSQEAGEVRERPREVTNLLHHLP